MRRLKAAAALGLVVLLAGQVGLAARVGLTAFPAPRARGAPGASDCFPTAAGGSLYDHTATGLDGSRVELAAFAGKVSLVVNLATF